MTLMKLNREEETIPVPEPEPEPGAISPLSIPELLMRDGSDFRCYSFLFMI